MHSLYFVMEFIQEENRLRWLLYLGACPEYGYPTRMVWHVYIEERVKPTRPGDSRVQNVRSVGGGNNIYVLPSAESIHLSQQCVHYGCLATTLEILHQTDVGLCISRKQRISYGP